MHIEDTI